jgi:hypothetical protein
MASPRPRRRRLLLPTVLAAVLAIEVTGLAIARSIATADVAPAAAGSSTTLPAAPPTTLPDVADRAGDAGTTSLPTAVAPSATKVRAAPAATPKPKSSGASSSKGSTTGSRAASFHGRNHVWIPALKISAGIQSFPCSRTRRPDAGVYRWGCAGRNNVYLLAHAWSTLKPLHDAYVGGRLRAGMKVWYADGSGRVREYSVAWWRVVAPTSAASWAWAAQTRPSMTLQTCVGANSQYRLMVRLLQVR